MTLSAEGPYARLYEENDALWGDHVGTMVRVFWSEVAAGRGPGPWPRVLDLGAGEGGNAIFLAERGFRVHLVEISRKALENYERRLRALPRDVAARLTHEQGRAGEVRVDAPYDIVIAYGLLHCFPSRDEARRIARFAADAVRPGGLVILSCLTDGVPAADDAHPELQSCYFPSVGELASWFDAFDVVRAATEQFAERHGDGPEHRHEVHRAVLARKEADV